MTNTTFLTKQRINLQKLLYILIHEFLVIFLIVALIQNFIVMLGRIPSGSMLPTLQIDDHILINRLAYLFHNVDRGDIIVFDEPALNEKLIKRVIGLPGDIIDMKNGKVYINGIELNESEYLSPTVKTHNASFISMPFLVPEDEYFVLGDNRTDSLDSRHLGTIKKRNIIGEAPLRFYPLNRIKQIS